MPKKYDQALRHRIEESCKGSHEASRATRYRKNGLTGQPTPIASKYFDKLMKAHGVPREQAAQTKASFECPKMEVRHASSGEKFIVTHGMEPSSGVFVSKQSIGATPEERIRRGALPQSNSARYETQVVLSKSQNVVTGKIAAQPGFAKGEIPC